MLVLNDVFEVTHYEPSRTIEPEPLLVFLGEKNWGDQRGLNPRQPESQSGALPTELWPPLTKENQIYK